MKRRILFLSVITLVGVGIVTILFAAVPSVPVTNDGFVRKWYDIKLEPDAVADIGYNSFYFGGYQNGQVYLGNSTSPLFVLSCSRDLKDTMQRIVTNISPSMGRSCQFLEQKGNFYLCDRITRHVYSGNVNDFRVKTTDSLKTATDLIYPLSAKNYLLRSYAFRPTRYTLSKQENGLVRADTTLIKNGENALFTSDGLFATNEDHSLFVYSYFYRNQFFSIDSNLKLLCTGRTIDTNFTAKLHLSSLKGGKAVTVTGRPRTVNVATCLHDSLLLIYSRLKADNQSEASSRKNNNIDVYHAISGTYLGSFTLPYYKGTQLSHLRVYDNYLYVLTGHYLVRYPLEFIKLFKS
jgi:hypothetical protein